MTTLTLPFTKMHGLGNDFVVLSAFENPVLEHTTLTHNQIQFLLHRQWGIGGDQLLILYPPSPQETTFDVRMKIFNPDSSEAEMCGNGIRAAARYLTEHKLVTTELMRFQTLAGIQIVRWHNMMGEVQLSPPKLIEKDFFEWETLWGTKVILGNPHIVFFVPDVQAIPLSTWGPAIEHHPAFPERTNVEFTQIMDRSTLHLRVWERGAGATLACGTGACASVVAAIHHKKTEPNVHVSLPGGTLKIRWDHDQPITMVGPAEAVFTGIITLPAHTP